jgi:hypothetical protein
MKDKAGMIFFVVLLFNTVAFAQDLQLGGTLSSGAYASNGTISTQGTCQVAPGSTVSFEAPIIKLKSGFHARPGSNFEARTVDADGLSNVCEMKYFGDLSHFPNDDDDQDGLTNAQECQLGYNPNETNTDNDGDGLPDAWEVQFAGLNLDSLAGRNGDADGDGISNWIEYKLGTNPLQAYGKGPGIYYEYDKLGRIKKIERLPSR